MKPVTDPSILEQLNGSQGMKPVSDPNILAQLNGEQPQEQGFLSKAGNVIKDAWQGNAQFQNAGNAEDYINHMAESGFYDNKGFFDKGPMEHINSLGLSGTFGNNNDIINRIAKINPNAQIKTDESGNRYIEADGKQFYGNVPGADLQDVGELAGEGLAYALGGGAGAAVKGYGLAARMGATGAAEAGINAVGQKIAGREEIDKSEVAIAGAGGTLFEGLTPLVSAVWRKFKNRGVSDLEAGEAVAKEMGLDGLAEDQTEKLGNLVRNLDPKQVTPETIAEHVQLNQTPTLGTLTKDQNILDTENMMRNSGRESTQKRFNMIDDANETGLNRAMGEAQENMSGGNRDFYTAANDIGDSVRTAEKSAKQGVKEAYDSVDSAYIGTEPFREAPQRFKKALSNEGVLLAPSTTKRANDVLQDVQKSIETMGDAKGVSWQAVEAQRKRINSAFAGAEPSDVRALGIIKDEYDTIVDEAFEKSLLSGSEESIKNLTKARGVAADYFKKFNGKGQGQKVIKQWLDDGVSPEQISNAFLSKTGVVGTKAPQVAKAYLDVVGRGTPEHNLLKELAIQRFTQDKGKAAIRNKLSEAMKNGQTFMNEVFTPKELGFLSRTVQFIDGTTLKGVKGRSSGSAERIFRWATKSAGQDVSLSGMLNGIKKAVDIAVGGERRVFNLPTKQLGVNPATGLGTQGAVNYSNQ